MTLVWVPPGRTKEVSFGWITPFLWKVERVEVVTHTDKYDVMMLCYLSDGRIFSHGWTNREHCWEWLHRQTLYGTPLRWCGEEITIEKGNKYKFGRNRPKDVSENP